MAQAGKRARLQKRATASAAQEQSPPRLDQVATCKEEENGNARDFGSPRPVMSPASSRSFVSQLQETNRLLAEQVRRIATSDHTHYFGSISMVIRLLCG